MKGTDGLSGLPEDPGHCTQDLVEPDHGKIENLVSLSICIMSVRKSVGNESLAHLFLEA
jgi:hypothetical protein